MFPPAFIPVSTERAVQTVSGPDAEGAIHTASGPDAEAWGPLVPIVFMVHFSQRAGASTGAILPF